MQSKTHAKLERMSENPESEVEEQAPCCEICSFSKIQQQQKQRRAHKKTNKEDEAGETSPHFNILLSTSSFSPQLNLFYWECTQIYTNIYTFLREERTSMNPMEVQPSNNSSRLFSEETVETLSNLLLKMFPMFFESIGYKQSDHHSTIAEEEEEEEEDHASQETPSKFYSMVSNESFVSVLSMILPTFRMYLEWALHTKNYWMTLTLSQETKQIKSNQGTQKSEINTLSSMLALHEALLRTTKELEKISLLIESHEENEINDAIGLLGESLSSKTSKKIPQVKMISNLFEEMLAEYKIILGSLTESILDGLEHIANRLCRPIMMKESSKSKLGSSLEYMKLLISQVLQPIADRLLASPTSSTVYLFPKILDKCIDIIIEEFAFSSSKLTEASVRQFQKSIQFLKTWTQTIEQQYNEKYFNERDSNGKILQYSGSKDSLQSGNNANKNNRNFSSFSSSTKSALPVVANGAQAEADLLIQQQQATTLSHSSSAASGVVVWTNQNQPITSAAIAEAQHLTIPMLPSKDPSTTDSDLGNNLANNPSINDTSSNTSSVMLTSSQHPYPSNYPHGSRRKFQLLHQVNGFKRLDAIFYAWIKKAAREDVQGIPEKLIKQGSTLGIIIKENVSKSITASINGFYKASTGANTTK